MPGIQKSEEEDCEKILKEKGWRACRSVSQLQEHGPKHNVFKKGRFKTVCARKTLKRLRMSSTVQGSALQIRKEGGRRAPQTLR